MSEAAGRAMPTYRSHKIVHALKIEAIVYDHEIASEDNRETDGSATITPADEGYAPFKVDAAYVQKHIPPKGKSFSYAGGYYVVYPPDGYASWSPAVAFEEGYTRI